MFAMAVFGGVETAFADSIYSFTTIDVPGALSTGASGINDSGQIVGGFWDGLNGHGFFLDVGGSSTAIDAPRAGETFAVWINSSGQIVAFFGAFGEHGFLDTGGSFTSIDVPGPVDTAAFGINNSGQIVGSFDDGRTTTASLQRPQSFMSLASLPLLAACLVGPCLSGCKGLADGSSARNPSLSESPTTKEGDDASRQGLD